MGGNTSTLNSEEQTRRMTTRTKKYGWKPDLPDCRDYYHSYSEHDFHTDVGSVDMREKMPPIYNLGELGSCTANAIAAAYQYLTLEDGKDVYPSRLFIYWNERSVENSTGSDSGACIRDGMKCVHQIGACEEEKWPYDISKFIDTPPQTCFDNAALHKSHAYRRIHFDIMRLRTYLNDGYPIIFGFTVYESFESDEVAKTGLMTMPSEGEKVLGGHAVLMVGFDDKSKHFIVRNSWGEEWGDKGYFYMPYDFVDETNCCDFWIMETVSEDSSSESSDKSTQKNAGEKEEEESETEESAEEEEEEQENTEAKEEGEK